MMRAIAAVLLAAMTCGLVGSELGMGTDYDAIQPMAAPMPAVPSFAATDHTTTKVTPPVLTVHNTTTVDYPLPTTELLGPDKPVKYGKIISICLKPLDSTPDNLQSVIYVWRITPTIEDLIVWPDNTRCFFGSGIEDATIRVEVIASYLFAQRQDNGSWTDVVNKIGVAERTVTIGGGAPIPPPNPPPGPGPNPGPTPPPAPPVLPDGKYKLAQSAYDWLAQVNLDSNQKKVDVAALAAAFSATAKQVNTSISAIAAGVDPEIHNADEALAASKAANTVAVGARRDAWLPWFANLKARLKELKLGTTKGSELQEMADGFNEIATGLIGGSK